MSRRLKDLQFLMQATAANSYNMQKQVVTGSLCYVVPKDIQPDEFNFKDHIKAVVLVACTCCTAFSLLPMRINGPTGLMSVDDDYYDYYVLDVEYDKVVAIGQIPSVFLQDYTFTLFLGSCDRKFLRDLSRVPNGDLFTRPLMQAWLASFNCIARKDGHVVLPWNETVYNFIF